MCGPHGECTRWVASRQQNGEAATRAAECRLRRKSHSGFGGLERKRLIKTEYNESAGDCEARQDRSDTDGNWT
ncbi:hypothetical protein PC129_g12935 [Phytophthora cactorum]|uniref:Uncharacterized protein n=1 Tax=Phytophthora cactorum TaxID=29920 RepID=A0A8T0ZA04_9STRA|nr:hypothetical protein Pcac1_g15976 [Phytophthora cactorum]KAG2859113.1 hypothetical protein PC113_g9232 [Phytophthora cactorum]KAG2905294.1 hypothetical protein PC115_g14672 [Phytophthora cactorum]KAG2943169.1 hypothetical protein PC117_g9521 [Phytophthora cactorum]KAG3021448.1 hypothetical protein PC119_g9625 [Phytophthora cactorum]